MLRINNDVIEKDHHWLWNWWKRLIVAFWFTWELTVEILSLLVFMTRMEICWYDSYLMNFVFFGKILEMNFQDNPERQQNRIERVFNHPLYNKARFYNPYNLYDIKFRPGPHKQMVQDTYCMWHTGLIYGVKSQNQGSKHHDVSGNFWLIFTRPTKILL